MANKYYYLISSLPYLEFDKPPTIDREWLLDEAKKWLTDKDLNIFKSVDVDNLSMLSSDTDIIKEQKVFELALRKDLKEARIIKRDSLDEKPPSQVRDIFLKANPLEMEKALLKKRWDFIEEIDLDYHFDLNVLIFYCMKLMIIERLFSFNKKDGLHVFENSCEVSYV